MTDMTVANTILAQLGGRRFIAMTGAKDLTGGSDSLFFSVGRNAKRINRVKVTLTAADDYTVEFGRYSPKNFTYTPVETVEGVYCENLTDVFTQGTGLLTSL